MCGDPLALFSGLVVAGEGMMESFRELSEGDTVWLRHNVKVSSYWILSPTLSIKEEGW